MNRLPGRCALLSALVPLLFATACGKPEPPDKRRPPDPQAAGQHAALRDAIQAPIDRAKAVGPVVDDAARQQQAQIDAQTGG